MQLVDRVVVVTGAASGIGRALAVRAAAEGARGVVVADVAADAVATVAAEIGDRALAVHTDVSKEADIVALVRRTQEAFGTVELFCSNAGIGEPSGPDSPDEVWRHMWDVNVMAHVWAARALLPPMLSRGEGYLLFTASAAGLLTNLGAAAYAVTKHATVAFAEWMAITYGDRGIRVSCLCPQAVRTPILLAELERGGIGGRSVLASGAILEPEDVAEIVVHALDDERFLVLTHPEVGHYLRAKATDPDGWLRRMRRLQARLVERSSP